jgi:hypothetical protein
MKGRAKCKRKRQRSAEEKKRAQEKNGQINLTG